MSKQLFILLSLFILCSSYLRPMEKKSKYGDDICRYEDNGYQYVRPCEKGKYCLKVSSEGSEFYICQDLPEVQEGLNTLEEKCSSNFDCENNLECIGSYCKLDCTSGSPVKLTSLSNTYSCVSPTRKADDGICMKKVYKDVSGSQVYDYTTYGNPTVKSQICGLFDFHHMGYQNYDLSEKKYAYIGSVDNGKYVSNEILCKSGFALFYYPTGNLQDPYNGGTSSISSNKMYKMCVTPITVEHYDPLLKSQKSSSISPSSSSCVIYYKEKDEDTTIKKYNVDQLSNIDTSIYTSTINTYKEQLCQYSEYEFKIKFQHFKEYTSNLKDDERDKCGILDGSTNTYRRYSCNNNDLIKSWYFYKNPQNYIVYNNREKLEVVLNYLIQKEYPSYEFSQILNINYLLSLLFLLCF